MGMTITEKIIAAHAGKPAVEPGEFVTVKPDLVMGNDLSTAGAIGVLTSRRVSFWTAAMAGASRRRRVRWRFKN
jgi:homoaconitase/3-isopropylmalate dehydratase large subunit